jgi:pimeloyl-ACP methyl ester carboxylesterase
MAYSLAEHASTRRVQGNEIEIRQAGSGPPLVLLHGSYGWWGWEPVLDTLARRFTVFAPSLPGFGRSPRAPGVDSVDDLAYWLLDLAPDLETYPMRVVGFGLGGWLAAEAAVRCPHAVERLVLVDSVGIKVSDRETRDIEDPFILVGEAQQAMLWADPSENQVPLPYPGMEPGLLEVMLRNQESALLYGWKPYMHNPKLAQRLHRITAPTMVVWGSKDRIVRPDYGRELARRIPQARFVEIPNAGHYPHREQADAFVLAIADFLS